MVGLCPFVIMFSMNFYCMNSDMSKCERLFHGEILAVKSIGKKICHKAEHFSTSFVYV